jgi:hypothetical protein
LNQSIRETITNKRTIELHGLFIGGGLCCAVVIIESTITIIPKLFPHRGLLLTEFVSNQEGDFATNTTLDSDSALSGRGVCVSERDRGRERTERERERERERQRERDRETERDRQRSRVCERR